MDEGTEVEDLDLSELSDSYLLSDWSKTSRIQTLQRDVELLSRHLVEAKNQLNTLNTEVLNYRRVHGQVSWLVNQLRYNLRGAERSHPLEYILPPPPPPLPPLTTTSTSDSIAVVPLQTSNSSKCAILDTLETQVSGSESDILTEDDDGYSEDWETTEETTATESGASALRVQPATMPGTKIIPPPSKETDLNVMLANVTPRTHISEIFRRWTFSSSS